jgi:hypothetical protein
MYLSGILNKYAIDISGASNAAQSLYPIIKRWSNGYLVEAMFSGSIAKGTGISLGTDADIFISISSSTPGTLEDMYDSLYRAVVSSGLYARKQNVSIGVEVNGFSVDLVPGRRQSQSGNDHSLFRNRARTWTQTNVAKHISYVQGSNRINEIKITKLWRELHGLTFPSFYLEMAVIDALAYARGGSLADNMVKVLEHLRDKILVVNYTDPSNTNNIISDDCTLQEKVAISQHANMSRSEQTWQRVVW